MSVLFVVDLPVCKYAAQWFLCSTLQLANNDGIYAAISAGAGGLTHKTQARLAIWLNIAKTKGAILCSIYLVMPHNSCMTSKSEKGMKPDMQHVPLKRGTEKQMRFRRADHAAGIKIPIYRQSQNKE